MSENEGTKRLRTRFEDLLELEARLSVQEERMKTLTMELQSLRNRFNRLERGFEEEEEEEEPETPRLKPMQFEEFKPGQSLKDLIKP